MSRFVRSGVGGNVGHVGGPNGGPRVLRRRPAGQPQVRQSGDRSTLTKNMLRIY